MIHLKRTSGGFVMLSIEDHHGAEAMNVTSRQGGGETFKMFAKTVLGARGVLSTTLMTTRTMTTIRGKGGRGGAPGAVQA